MRKIELELMKTRDRDCYPTTAERSARRSKATIHLREFRASVRNSFDLTAKLWLCRRRYVANTIANAVFLPPFFDDKAADFLRTRQLAGLMAAQTIPSDLCSTIRRTAQTKPEAAQSEERKLFV
jgi:hypothetical protein